MIKSAELTDPQSCMSKAQDNEMTFVLLSRDSAAPDTIRYWCQLRISQGKNRPDDEQILHALDSATLMEEQRLRGI